MGRNRASPFQLIILGHCRPSWDAAARPQTSNFTRAFALWIGRRLAEPSHSFVPARRRGQPRRPPPPPPSQPRRCSSLPRPAWLRRDQPDMAAKVMSYELRADAKPGETKVAWPDRRSRCASGRGEGSPWRCHCRCCAMQIRRNVAVGEGPLVDHVYDDVRTLYENFQAGAGSRGALSSGQWPLMGAHTRARRVQRGLSLAKDKPCLGTRARNADGSLGDYQWLTYGEVSAHGGASGRAHPDGQTCSDASARARRRSQRAPPTSARTW